jgi:hypothetical protein
MDLLNVSLALGLSIALGSVWVRLLVPRDTPARAALIIGYGTLLGLLLTTVLLRLTAALGAGLAFGPTAALCGVLTALGLLVGLCLRRPHTTPVPIPLAPTWAQLSTGGRLLFCALLALVLWRIGLLTQEVYWRPLFPWDATMHWATKARVWFEHRELVPFVGGAQWLEAAGEGVYTDRHPEYPPAIPLLQVWMSLALERWDESLMNLPWVAAFVALGLAFFAQLRVAGLGLPLAMAATYVLMSMPLINIHVALAGYADMFLGATFACALMALHNWSVGRDRWQGILLVIFAACCYLLKNEGAVWPMTIAPAIAAAFMARREAAKLFVLFCLLGLFGWLVIPKDIGLAGITLRELQPTFDVEALVGVLTSVLIHGSWHLAGYGLLALLALGALMPKALTRDFLPLTVALGCAVGLFLFLFLFTGFGWAAANYTAVGRLGIQLAPGLIFLGALLAHEFIRGRAVRFWGPIRRIRGPA